MTFDVSTIFWIPLMFICIIGYMFSSCLKRKKKHSNITTNLNLFVNLFLQHLVIQSKQKLKNQAIRNRCSVLSARHPKLCGFFFGLQITVTEALKFGSLLLLFLIFFSPRRDPVTLDSKNSMGQDGRRFPTAFGY